LHVSALPAPRVNLFQLDRQLSAPSMELLRLTDQTCCFLIELGIPKPVMHLAEMNYFTNLETYVLGDANPGSINKNLGF
jgi:hypothetical protein